MGAAVTVIEARDRVGGRVWTIRDGFADRQHAEAGGDMIDESQDEIRQLARELGLTLSRILRDGFGYVRPGAAGSSQPPRIVSRSIARGWGQLGEALGRPHPPLSAGRTALGLAHHRRPRPPFGRAVAR